MSTDVDWAKAVEEEENTLVSTVKGLTIDNADSKSTDDCKPVEKPSWNDAVEEYSNRHRSESPKTTSTSSLRRLSDPRVPDHGAQAALAETNNVAADEEEKEISTAEASLIRKILRSKLVKSTNDIEIQRKNPNSPLYSVKSFEALNLRPELLKGVFAMGFNSPSKIQESTLPILLANPPENLIAQSQSGTGKTAAFVLAMLSRVDPKKNYTQILGLSPTYELTVQTGEVLKQMSQFCPDITIRFAIRGEDIARGQTINEHIVLGTPGKVLDWCRNFRCFDPKKISVFVLDEADVMIATQGHRDQSIRIHKMLSKECQMMLFSATYDRDVMEFAEMVVPDPIIIGLRREEESLDNIKQYYVECHSKEDKYNALANIYGVISIGQAMIFCQTRTTASWLSEKMSKDGHAVALLSGELEIPQRIAVLNRFREGKEKVLITTNVCARGIDVEQVTVVVNFDLPVDKNYKPDFETYLHRIGRTGRFGKNGIAINMVDGQKSMGHVRQIESHFGRKIVCLDAEDVDEIEKIGQN